MDQGTDGGRTFHSIRQPHIEWQLSGFSGTGNEEEQADRRCSSAASRYGTNAAKDASKVNLAIIGKDQKDCQHQAEVADDVDDESFASGGDGGTALIPEADKQERSEANQSPTDEQEEEVIGGDEHNHRENKEVQE